MESTVPLLTVKADDAEYVAWKRRAAEVGQTLSQWVREVLNQGPASVASEAPLAAEGGDEVGSFPPPGGDARSAGAMAVRSAPHTREPKESGSGVALHRKSRSGGRASSTTHEARATLGPVAQKEGPDDPGQGASESPDAAGDVVTSPLRDTATTPAPATPLRQPCTHPHEKRSVKPWGSMCGVCGALVR